MIDIIIGVVLGIILTNFYPNLFVNWKEIAKKLFNKCEHDKKD